VKKLWSRVARATWSDQRFLELSGAEPNAQTLWLYLLTTPRNGFVPGLIAAGVGGFADDLGWDAVSTHQALQELEQSEMVRVSRRPPLVWLPRAIRYNQPANPNILKKWRRALDEVPECLLRDLAIVSMEGEIKSCAVREAFPKVFADLLGPARQRLERAEERSYLHPDKDPLETVSQTVTETVSQTVFVSELSSAISGGYEGPFDPPVDSEINTKSGAKKRSTAKPRNRSANGSAKGSANGMRNIKIKKDIKTPYPLPQGPYPLEVVNPHDVGSSSHELALYLFANISNTDPAYAENRVTERSFGRWVRDVGYLLRIDKADPYEVAVVIYWAHNVQRTPKFSWRAVILSGSSLRKSFTKMRLQAINAGVLKAGVGEEQFKTEYGAWVLRTYDRAESAKKSFDAGYLIDSAKLEGLPPLREDEAARIADWAKERRGAGQ
tara:strand:- start:1109 stop:2425 length:1317 start_codon:yes stop_codon:yes gene_type:complete